MERFLTAILIVVLFLVCRQSAADAPAVLRNVGFDQRLNEQVPLDAGIHRRKRQDGETRRLFRIEAGGARAGLLSLSDALHAGA